MATFIRHRLLSQQFISESHEGLLSLFSHRFDYLYADFPLPDESPQWLTESRHPLSDRKILKGGKLYGVRFGTQTTYALLDIDRDSIYHPSRDRHAIARMMDCLEEMGICAQITVTSSYRGGLHVYLPLNAAFPTWKVAAVVTALLERGGFRVEPGLLEVLPNRKEWGPGKQTLYNGHRLPLQAGSYLVGSGNELLRSFPSTFVTLWGFCTLKNNVQSTNLDKLLANTATKHPKLTVKASKFLEDLNTEITLGWSGHGQTNALLGKITLREYVFGHILNGGIPQTGDRLIGAIVAVAQSLPGYRQWCRHQHEIAKRAEDWQRCVENSHYWPYKGKREDVVNPSDANDDPLEGDDPLVSYNAYRQQEARDRIAYRLSVLLDEGRLPAGATDRFLILIREAHCSGQTLYRHRDIWHPAYLWNSPPDPPSSLEVADRGIALEHPTRPAASSLLDIGECNPNDDEGYRQFLTELFPETGCNEPCDSGFSDFESKNSRLEDDSG